MFKNAPSHQKQAHNAILAWKMVKSEFFFAQINMLILTTPQTQSEVGVCSVVMACGADLSRASNKIAINMKVFGDVAYLNVRLHLNQQRSDKSQVS